MISLLKPLKSNYRVFFFFPFYHIGGAEKVHAQVAAATGGKDCIIFFTRKSHNDLFLNEFKQSGCVIKDIAAFTDNKWLYFLNLIFRGIISGYINRQQESPIVFNGQCNFGYKISPWINKHIPQVELIHSFNSFSYIRTPFLPFITRTVMISKQRIEDHAAYYNRISVPAAFVEKIQYIPNAVQLPAVVNQKDPGNFMVLYVGRGGVEKRVHLIAEMARRMDETRSGMQFEMLGDVTNVIDPSRYPFIRFHGNQHSADRIRAIYEKAAVLLITSDTEGFPLVMIEAMAYGAPVIATPVGDIPRHLTPGINGYLFSSVKDEEKIIQEGIAWIRQLHSDRKLLMTMGENNMRYARAHFAIEAFNKTYRELFESLNRMP